MSTDVLAERPANEDTPTEQPKPKGRLLPRLTIAALATLLAASVAGGVMQFQKAEKVSGQLDTARSSLVDTKKELTVVSDDLSTAQTDLYDATATMSVCTDVSEAALELFTGWGGLLDAMLLVLDDEYAVTEIETAGENLDVVKALIEENGYETIEEFVAGCAGDSTVL